MVALNFSNVLGNGFIRKRSGGFQWALLHHSKAHSQDAGRMANGWPQKCRVVQWANNTAP
jgi:hypothetical protein